MAVSYFEFRLKSNILAKCTTNKIRSRYPRLNLESFQKTEGGQQLNFDIATSPSGYLAKGWRLSIINLLAPELFFFNFSTPCI